MVLVVKEWWAVICPTKIVALAHRNHVWTQLFIELMKVCDDGGY